LSQRTLLLSLLEVNLSNPGLVLLLESSDQLRRQVPGPVLRITGSRSDAGIYPSACGKYTAAQLINGQRGESL